MKPNFSVSLLLCFAIVHLLQSCSTTEKQAANIRVRWPHDPEALDPLQRPNQLATDAVNLLHISLLQSDFSKEEYAPALADTFPKAQLIGDSLTRLTYRLRPEATWDNGRPVLATDVAFTLKLMFCPGVPNETSRIEFGFIRALIDKLRDVTIRAKFAISFIIKVAQKHVFEIFAILSPQKPMSHKQVFLPFLLSLPQQYLHRGSCCYFTRLEVTNWLFFFKHSKKYRLWPPQ